MPHTPLLSPPLYLQCISVRKRRRAIHGSERQRKKEQLSTLRCGSASL